MGTIVEAVVPADEFALQETTEALAKSTFQLERVVAQDTEHILPFMWVNNADQDDLEDALRADPTVKEFELVIDLGSKWLYQLNWTDRIETLVGTIVEEDAVLLEAESANTTWELKFLFVEREAISRVREHFESAGTTFDVQRIYDQREGSLGTRGLTKHQYRTLTLALKHGYYDIPRTTNAKGLASELDISHQALSEQLRRAHRAIVADTVHMSASVLSERSDVDEQE